MACGLAVNLAAAAVLVHALYHGPATTVAKLRSAAALAKEKAITLVREVDSGMAGAHATDLALAATQDAYTFDLVDVPMDPGHGYGRLLRVGPGREYARPSEAARAAKPGDVVEIDAGEYHGDSVIWSVDDLLIRGVGGVPHIDAAGTRLVQEKGIWLIQGDNVRVEHIEFSGAASRDKNGAAIRAEGDRLHVVACYFHDNESGILANPVTGGRMTVEYSEFARNGHPNGQAHQVYITFIDEFTLRFNHIHATRIGSAVKSRARVNRILFNRIVDGRDGSSNYSIDLSNGGQAYVIGNEIEQGPKTENYHLIAFAPEGARYDLDELFVVHNTLVNDRYNGVFVRNFSKGRVYLYNNLLLGAGEVSAGDVIAVGNVRATAARFTFGGDDLGASAGSRANHVVSDPGVIDRGRLDYRLAEGSAAIDAGVTLEEVNGQRIAPDLEYRHPRQRRARHYAGAPDAGAFEFAGRP